MNIPFYLPSITQDDKDAVLEVLNSQWLTGGQKTVEFEKQFADYIGVKHVIAVNSCTAALHLSLLALGIGKGDEVIVPTMTFAATANAPIFCGAKPVFADIDEHTFNISVESIKSKINSKTKAIIPVHLAGQPSDMEDIIKVALDYNLYVVEDCAHSLGATYKGKQTGSLSDIGCFSFYASKNLNIGEGGMLTTNNGEYAKKVKLMRSHCMSREAYDRSKSGKWYYDIVGLGFNYRLTEYQSALGISLLKRLEVMNNRRADISDYYTEKLGKIKGIKTPYLSNDRTTSYHLYIIRVIEKEYGISRDELFRKLADKGIECSVHYTPLHRMSFYKKYAHDDYPIANKVYNEILSLPLFPSMTREQMGYIVEHIEVSAK